MSTTEPTDIPVMTNDNDGSDTVGVVIGFKTLADLKMRLGEWLVRRREDDGTVGVVVGFKPLADLKIQFGGWLRERRQK